MVQVRECTPLGGFFPKGDFQEIMNGSSDIDTLHAQVILLKMRTKSTEELIIILADKNRKNWSEEEEYETAQRVLQERTGNLPERKQTSSQRTTQPKSKQTFETGEPVGEPFFNLSPYNNFRVGCIIFGVIFMIVISTTLLTINQIWILISR